MPGNQSNGSDYGLGTCEVQSTTLVTSNYGMSGGRCSAVVRRPCLSRAAYKIGMASGTVEVSPNLEACGQVNGQNSSGVGRHRPDVWLQGPQPGGCVGQERGDRSLKTLTRLTFGDISMAGPIYRP